MSDLPNVAMFYERKGKTYIEVRNPGSNDVLKRQANPDDIQTYASAYQAFEEGKAAPAPDGTPMSELPGVTADTVLHLRLLNIHTIEQMAEVSEAAFDKIGMGARDIQKNARNFIKAKESDDIRRREAELEARIQELEANQRRKPGRPAKEMAA